MLPVSELVDFSMVLSAPEKPLMALFASAASADILIFSAGSLAIAYTLCMFTLLYIVGAAIVFILLLNYPPFLIAACSTLGIYLLWWLGERFLFTKTPLNKN